jgi:predicted enzyme related to lactoylglutathione lyase
MGERERYPPGTFSWADLRTTDAAAAKAFYTKVFGWEAADGEADTRFSLDGKDVAALHTVDEEAHWSSYVTVEDVDAAVAKARELGGEVPVEPLDVAEAGRTAVVRDPVGALVYLWQPKGEHGAGRVNEPGCMVWNELASPDLDKAREYYTGLFGWTLETEDGTGYEVIRTGGALNGGLRGTQEDEPPHWLVYFTVPASCDETAGVVREAGGQVIAGPMDTGVGRIAIVADPQGARFALFEGESDP